MSRTASPDDFPDSNALSPYPGAEPVRDGAQKPAQGSVPLSQPWKEWYVMQKLKKEEYYSWPIFLTANGHAFLPQPPRNVDFGKERPLSRVALDFSCELSFVWVSILHVYDAGDRVRASLFGGVRVAHGTFPYQPHSYDTRPPLRLSLEEPISMDISELAILFFCMGFHKQGRVEKIQDREDRKTLRGFRNYDDILEHVINDPDEPISDLALRELSMIRLRLVELRDFSSVFAHKLGPELDPAFFWGMLGLMLTVSAQMEEIDTTRRLTQMLKALNRNVDVLRGHTTSADLFNKDKEAVFETFVAMTRFFAEVVQFLRDDEHFIRCRSTGRCSRIALICHDQYKLLTSRETRIHGGD
ncbi:hypothetical protein GQ44DRAFT_776005 [Phaeosphaeriaceae sp. PMI808]|nr:hypothetical protein GQ44DRAFT_776005 [Phaeosphaeriaceae sp. PMI808]